METRKGILTPKQEEFVATVLDGWFKFKNVIVEKFDYLAFLNIVRTADNMGAQRIPEVWKSELIPIIDAAMEERFEDVRKYTVDLLNKKIDIKHLDDEQELIVFDAFSKFIGVAIDWYVQKNK